ncbi:lysophospholipid acyltransferase family protein [Bacillus alkalicellulosilyticus]|uniref:lysophospholipid acyltransferase family protein n=1 Tax=Alkalihalobacterium alkalicellulosilyticum TaxID=1912214 RepID=UPI001115FB95|nr:lysophospholipid acyltransferase family protein [Bacillus alkalicellulosilyticus]
MKLYRFGQFISRAFLSSLYRVEVIGQENLPEEGPVLLCCNHIHNFDPPLLGAYIQRPIRYMAKQELFKYKFSNWLLRSVGAFPVRRGMSDKQAMRVTIQFLRDNEMIGLFPEGTRSKDGQLQKGLAGAGFFSLRTEATVIPCAIVGPYKPFKKLKLVYGPPIDMVQLREDKISVEDATAVIMDSIRSLLVEHKTS